MAHLKSLLLVFVLLVGTLVASFSSPAAAEAPAATLNADPDQIWDVANTDTDVSHTGTIRALVWDFEEYQGRLYVGGKFLDVVAPDGTTRDQAYLAAFDIETGEWISSFTPNVGGPVYALDMTNDGRLLAGGEVPGGVVAVDVNSGELDTGFQPGIINSWGSAGVFDIEVVGSDVYVGGRFSKAQDIDLQNLGKFNVDSGQIDTSWTPKAELDTGTPRQQGQLVYAIEVDTTRDRVYIIGKFGSIDGNLDAAYFATLSQADASFKDVPQGLPPQVLSHRESFSMRQYDVQFRDDRVYIGGQAHQTLILRASDLEPLNSYFTNAGVGDLGRGGDTQVMYIGETTLWSGCHCWGSVGPYELGSYNNDRADGVQTYDEYRQFVVDFRTTNPFGQQKVRGAYGVDLATGELTQQQFNLSGQAGGWAMHEDSNGRLWMGGQFAVGNGRVGEGIARFSPLEQELEPVSTCTVTPEANNTLSVSWPEAATAQDYVIYRTVNDSPQYWRGKTSNLTFTDTTRSGDINYYVAAKRGNELADRTLCD